MHFLLSKYHIHDLPNIFQTSILHAHYLGQVGIYDDYWKEKGISKLQLNSTLQILETSQHLPNINVTFSLKAKMWDLMNSKNINEESSSKLPTFIWRLSNTVKHLFNINATRPLLSDAYVSRILVGLGKPSCQLSH